MAMHIDGCEAGGLGALVQWRLTERLAASQPWMALNHAAFFA